MKKLGMGVMILMGFIISIPTSFADEIQLPFAVKEKAFIKEMKKNGMDLSRSDKSQGFVEDRGGNFKVFTYKPATLEQLDLIQKIAFKNMRENG